MKRRNVLAVVILPMLALSCSHLSTPKPETTTSASKDGQLLKTLQASEHREMLKAASRRLDEVRKLLDDGDVEGARTALEPLVGQNLFTNEVKELASRISDAQNRAMVRLAQDESERRALFDVEKGLVLPSTYNSTIVIKDSNEPFNLPKGPMEELFNRRVDINVKNAGVKELVAALTQIEGLNVIADDALEAQNSITINVRNTPLKEILGYIARNMGIAFHIGENVVWVTKSDTEPGSGPELETQIYRLREGFIPTLKTDADDGGGGGGGEEGAADLELEDALASILTDSPEGATYHIFKHRNLLMVRDTREHLRLVEKLLEQFDKAPRQVLIEARFLVVGQDDLKDVGVELAQTMNFNRKTLPNGDPNPNYDPLKPTDPDSMRLENFLSIFGTASSLAKSGEYGQLSLGGVLGNRTFNILISAINKTTTARTLSAPRVAVLNNHTARIRRGDKVLYYDELETVAASGGGDGGDAATQTAFTGTPKELELGVTLEVKVNVGNDGKTILLALAPEVIELKQWRQFNVVAGNGDNYNDNSDNGDNTDDNAMGQLELPETTESTVKTTVKVRSGETVALGGLVNLRRQKDVKKVPWLGDIPFIGFFFRRTTEKDVPVHLLIFVTAKVLDDSGRFVTIESNGGS